MRFVPVAGMPDTFKWVKAQPHFIKGKDPIDGAILDTQISNVDPDQPQPSKRVKILNRYNATYPDPDPQHPMKQRLVALYDMLFQIPDLTPIISCPLRIGFEINPGTALWTVTQASKKAGDASVPYHHLVTSNGNDYHVTVNQP